MAKRAERRERREVHYSGRVQGVGFRFTACRVAARFEVAGFVQNLADGRVLLAAEGQPAELDRFLQAVQTELDRNISGVDSRSAPATGEWTEFTVRY